MRGLGGKVAVVTGGLGDLGRATIIRLLEEGCRVASYDLKPDANGELTKLGVDHHIVDITDETSIQIASLAVRKKFGLVTIFVSTAAHFVFRGVEASAREWEDILAVNVIGASLVAKVMVEQMKEAGGGSVILFSSVSGFVGQANFSTYNATKFALRGMAKCWAQDLAPHGIRVNTLCPGYIYTSAFENSCRKLDLDIETENRRASGMHLLGRQGRPEEVAAAAAFLASEDASFITGSDLIVDGGYLAK